MSEEIKAFLRPGKKNLILIYILYLAGFLVPIFPLIGAALAYANKSSNNITWQSHYIFALRTFYIGVIGIILSIVVAVVLAFVGLITYILVFIWFIVRVIIALQMIIQDLPHSNPLTFWIK